MNLIDCKAVAAATGRRFKSCPPDFHALNSMRPAILGLTVSLLAVIAQGQEPPLPAATATPGPSVRPELNIPDIPMPVEPAPLVPNASTSATPKKNLPSLTELDSAFQHSSLGQAVEEQRLHLEWRKLKNRTAQDPEILAAKKAAASARTEVEKRELMRAYYKIFYARMQALAEAPDVKAYLAQKKTEAINGLAQPHVRPEPTPRPKATP
jgi:hypothetical protein